MGEQIQATPDSEPIDAAVALAAGGPSVQHVEVDLGSIEDGWSGGSTMPQEALYRDRAEHVAALGSRMAEYSDRLGHSLTRTV